MRKLGSLAALIVLLSFPAKLSAKDQFLLPASGFYDAPLQISITPSKASVRWTTDGSTPSLTNGHPYVEPLAITNTTVLRIAAFKKERAIGEVSTHTYLFPRDIIRQSGSGFPTDWGTNKGSAVPAYYRMAPEIAFAPEYRDSMERSLKVLPSVSLVFAPEDLFGTEHGIYKHPEEAGAAWERAASF